MPDADRFPRWLAWIASKKRGRTMARVFYTPVDKVIYRLTRGRRGLSPRKTVLYLTTTGRQSGKPRRVPILFLRAGDRYWVMASNYGQQHHPGWSANLLAEPRAIVQEGPKTLEVTARLATSEKREHLWPRLLELYPAWHRYSEWTDRDFRLFCLEAR